MKNYVRNMHEKSERVLFLTAGKRLAAHQTRGYDPVEDKSTGTSKRTQAVVAHAYYLSNMI